MNYTLKVQEDKETGEYYIELPHGVLVSANIDIGDSIEWSMSDDNSYATLTKIDDETS
jgi:uncharacterized membrane protein (UPF0127 family)|tara:strand:- start:4515 stop:4688 length:174 start_codon:yes stop_codon:yes gene_type:complete